MNGYVRPSLALVRAWFFLVGISLLVCFMAMYDYNIPPMKISANTSQSGTLSSTLR
ncbi:MAG: hypothetical protein H7X80_07355 [bacterium]|nr:hypothetical protein [Candidatus Kapabacteria bacterium]